MLHCNSLYALQPDKLYFCLYLHLYFLWYLQTSCLRGNETGSFRNARPNDKAGYQSLINLKYCSTISFWNSLLYPYHNLYLCCSRESHNVVPHHDFGVFGKSCKAWNLCFCLWGAADECVDELEFWPDKNTLKQISFYEKCTFTCYVKEFTLDEETVLFCWWKKILRKFRFSFHAWHWNAVPFNALFFLSTDSPQVQLSLSIQPRCCCFPPCNHRDHDRDFMNSVIQTAWRSTCVLCKLH